MTDPQGPAPGSTRLRWWQLQEVEPVAGLEVDAVAVHDDQKWNGMAVDKSNVERSMIVPEAMKNR